MPLDAPLLSLVVSPFDTAHILAHAATNVALIEVERELQGYSLARHVLRPGKDADGAPPAAILWDQEAGSVLIAGADGTIVKVHFRRDADAEGAPVLTTSVATILTVPFAPTTLAISRHHLVVGGREAQVAAAPLSFEHEPSKLESPPVMQLGGAAPVASLIFGGHELSLLLVSLADGRVLCTELQPYQASPAGPVQLNKLVDAHAGAVKAVAAIFDGRHVASTGDDGTLRIWDATTGALAARLTLGGAQTALCPMPSRGLLALGSATGVVRIVSVAAPTQPVVVFRTRLHTAPVAALAFSPSGDVVVSAGQDRRLFFTRVGSPCFPLGFVFAPEDLANVTWPQGEAGLGPAVGILETGELLWVVPPTSGADVGTDLQVAPKDAALRRMKLDAHLDAATPALLSDGASGLLAIGFDRGVRLYTVPKELQAWGGPKGRVHHADAKSAGPEKRGRAVALCASQEIFAYGGLEGTLSIKPVAGLAHAKVLGEATLHDISTGGLQCCSFDATGAWVVSGGADGSLFVCAVLGSGHLTTPGPSPAPLASSLPEGDDGCRADVADEPHVIDDLRARAQAQLQLLSQPVKEMTRKKIEGLRQAFQNILEESENAPELERLGPEDLVVDVRMCAAMDAAGRQRVQKIVDEILRDIKVNEVIHQRMKAMVWDAMEVHGQVVSGLQSLVIVRNFPLPKEGDEDRLGNRAALLRQVEMQEEQYMVQETGDERFRTKQTFAKKEEASTSGAGAAATTPGAASDPPKLLPRTSTMAQGDEVLQNISENGDGPRQGIEKLMYSPFDLSYPNRRVTQIYLIRSRVRQIKRAFNVRFSEIAKRKQAEVDRILDTNQRIHEIFKDLERLNRLPGGLPSDQPLSMDASVMEPLFVPPTDDLEEQRSVLTVKDSEVPVERYLSPEEHARLEAAQRAEEARLAALKKDDVFDRALKMMMGGALESHGAEDDEFELVKPEWMNGDPSKFNEEKIKQLRAFQAREKQIEEEKEKKRAALEREIKALKGTIDEGAKKFDEALTELYRSRLATKTQVHELEMRMVRLAAGLDSLRQYSAQSEAKLLSKLEELSSVKAQAEKAAAELRHHVDMRAVFIENLAAEDKAMEKAFKKEFAEAGDYLPALLQLFKRRQPCRRADVPVELQGNPAARKWAHTRQDDRPASAAPESDPDKEPFAGIHRGYNEPYPEAGRREVELDYFEPLDAAQDLPEGLPYSLWERLVEVRAHKIESELRLRAEQRLFEDMQRKLVQLQREETARARELEACQEELRGYHDRRETLLNDLEIPLTLRQGQVEVDDPEPGDDSMLLHRSVVEKVNEVIREHGDKKVEILTAIKDFKKGIYELQWTNQRLELESEDWAEKTKEFQLLRVTKDLQQALRSGTAENSSSLEVQQLEKNLEHQQRLHAKNVADREAAIRRIEKQINERRRQNGGLGNQWQDLGDMIEDERRIQMSQSMGKGEDGAGQDEIIQKRMRSLVTQARLRDIALAQEGEIEALKAELERLRLRTFPSFVERTNELPDQRTGKLLAATGKMGSTAGRPAGGGLAGSMTRGTAGSSRR